MNKSENDEIILYSLEYNQHLYSLTCRDAAAAKGSRTTSRSDHDTVQDHHLTSQRAARCCRLSSFDRFGLCGGKRATAETQSELQLQLITWERAESGLRCILASQDHRGSGLSLLISVLLQQPSSHVRVGSKVKIHTSTKKKSIHSTV